jgi:hypothetical protein
VAFDEDRSNVRTQNAPRAMAALRNAVLGWLHLKREPNISAALRRFAGRPKTILRILRTRPQWRMK